MCMKINFIFRLLEFTLIKIRFDIILLILFLFISFVYSEYDDVLLAIKGKDTEALIYKLNINLGTTEINTFSYYFLFENKKYYGYFGIRKRHENLEIGDTIPVKFLESNPKVNEAFFKGSIYYKLSKYINP
jgi:hypothetical protein